MSIIRAINKYYADKEKRGWKKGYFFFDIHGTILRPNYEFGNTPKDFYDHSMETLQLISTIPDICMILYTCSHPEEIEQYISLFKDHNINFQYINENPEVVTDVNGYGCYDSKPYVNVLFEDKAGFDPETEWVLVLELMKELYPNIK